MQEAEMSLYCQGCKSLLAELEAEKTAHEKAERERDEARLVIREFLASGVEHDDPRMDYITMQVDRVTIDAARAAGEGGGND